MATIAGNIALARQQAIIVGFLTAASLALWLPFNRRVRYPAVCLLLLSFHPAWTMSATRGDCGYGMANNALGVTLLAIVVVGFQVRYAVGVWKARRRRLTPGAG
jgi:hypothetical protein